MFIKTVISSAYANTFGQVQLSRLQVTGIISSLACMFLMTGSMARIKSEQLSASPCFTPFPIVWVSQFSKCGLSTYRNAFKHYPTSNSGNIFKNSASTSNLNYFINTSALFCLSTYVQKWSNTLQDPYNETNDNGNGTLSYVGGKNSLQFPPVIRGYCC